MRLTFEMTRGTRTIYFPLETCEGRPADFVVVVRPFQADPNELFDETDEFEVGIAICNPADQFVKRQGRAIAFERLNSAHKISGSAHHIIEHILSKVREINIRRDPDLPAPKRHLCSDMDEGQIELDLIQVMSYDALSAYFLKKEENRGGQPALLEHVTFSPRVVGGSGGFYTL